MMNSSNGSSSNADPPVYIVFTAKKRKVKISRFSRKFSHFVRFPEIFFFVKFLCISYFAKKNAKSSRKKNTEKMQKNTR